MAPMVEVAGFVEKFLSGSTLDTPAPVEHTKAPRGKRSHETEVNMAPPCPLPAQLTAYQ